MIFMQIDTVCGYPVNTMSMVRMSQSIELIEKLQRQFYSKNRRWHGPDMVIDIMSVFWRDIATVFEFHAASRWIIVQKSKTRSLR